jgi:hypothetical protein
MTDSPSEFLTLPREMGELRFTAIGRTLVFVADDIARWTDTSPSKNWAVTRQVRHSNGITWDVITADGVQAVISYNPKRASGDKEVLLMQFRQIETACWEKLREADVERGNHAA